MSNGSQVISRDWFKIIVAMVVQLISVAWFFSAMASDVKHNREMINAVKKQQNGMVRRVYAIDTLERDVGMIFDELKEISRELRDR